MAGCGCGLRWSGAHRRGATSTWSSWCRGSCGGSPRCRRWRTRGPCAARLRTAMVIFGTIGWPIKNSPGPPPGGASRAAGGEIPLAHPSGPPHSSAWSKIAEPAMRRRRRLPRCYDFSVDRPRTGSQRGMRSGMPEGSVAAAQTTNSRRSSRDIPGSARTARAGGAPTGSSRQTCPNRNAGAICNVNLGSTGTEHVPPNCAPWTGEGTGLCPRWQKCRAGRRRQHVGDPVAGTRPHAAT